MDALTAAETVKLLLADSRLPSGGHVSSSGLEPALMGGLRTDQVRDFLKARVRTVATVDAGTAVVARHLLMQQLTPASASEALRHLERAWAARTPSQSQREIARELGRGLLRLATVLWPDQELFAVKQLPRPLVLGLIAAHTEMAPTSLVRLIVYDDVASAAAALLKLEPSDPAHTTAMVLQSCAAAEPEVGSLAALTTAHEIPAASAPQLEEWVERHATTPRRLFRA